MIDLVPDLFTKKFLINHNYKLKKSLARITGISKIVSKLKLYKTMQPPNEAYIEEITQLIKNKE